MSTVALLDRSYWLTALSSLPKTALPSDGGLQGPARRSVYRFPVIEDAAGPLLAAAESPAALLPLAFGTVALVVARHAAARDLLIGTPASLDGGTGARTPMLPVRCSIEPEINGRDFLEMVNEALGAAFKHEHALDAVASELFPAGGVPIATTFALRSMQAFEAPPRDQEVRFTFDVRDSGLLAEIDFDARSFREHRIESFAESCQSLALDLLSRAEASLEELLVVKPRTPMEVAVARIFADVLTLDDVSVFDNFFHRGGDSLLVTRAVAHIRDRFGVDLPLPRFFELPTVCELALEITNLRLQNATASELNRILDRVHTLTESAS